MMKKNVKKYVTLSCLLAIAAGAVAGCAPKAQTLDLSVDPPVITIMGSAYQAQPAEDGPVLEAVEDYLGVDLQITWTASSGYDEKITATMASGEYPMIMQVGTRSSSVIQNSRAGSFWEVGEEMKDATKYPNLSQANPLIQHNISIDGNVYGLYKSRDLGRNGVSIRTDWLENLGLEIPKTLDEFGEVLRAFTEDDPNQDGIQNTYGMIVTAYTGPLDNLLVWCGAPNKYGWDEEKQEIRPAHEFPEYMEGLDLMKTWLEAGYINQDMATRSSDKWDEDFLNGHAGVIIDVADRARRLQTNIAKIDPDATVGVFGSVAKDENSERRVLPTTGYNGFFVLPKAALPNESDMQYVLGVIDRMQDATASDLMQYGIEGTHYTIGDDGYIVQTQDAQLKQDFADLNQLLTFMTDNSNINVPYANETAKEVELVLEDNAQYSVPNPAESYVSKAYSLSGPQLDAVISQANIGYIMGNLTKEDWYSEMERWGNMGGNQVVKEMNEAYQADTSEYKTIY